MSTKARKSNQRKVSTPVTPAELEQSGVYARIPSDLPPDDPDSRLFDLMCEAIGSDEFRRADAFVSGALSTLSDDLITLYHACTDDTGHLSEERLDHEQLVTALWRLSRRARVIKEVHGRWAAAERRKAVGK
jgi:hypothetical protein